MDAALLLVLHRRLSKLTDERKIKRELSHSVMDTREARVLFPGKRNRMVNEIPSHSLYLLLTQTRTHAAAQRKGANLENLFFFFF